MVAPRGDVRGEISLDDLDHCYRDPFGDVPVVELKTNGLLKVSKEAPANNFRVNAKAK